MGVARVRAAILGTILAVAFIAGGLATCLLESGNPAHTQVVVDPFSISPILQSLGPGSTVHTVELEYRRHGGDAQVVPASEGPERVQTESWLTFDVEGAVQSFRAETRDTSGTLLEEQTLQDGDLLYLNVDGTIRQRVTGFQTRVTLDSLRSRIAKATIQAANAVATQVGQSGTSTTGLVVVDTQRDLGPVASAPSDGTGYTIPYVEDLNPVKKIDRQYISPSDYREIKDETVIVSQDGSETVVESREYNTFEVLAPDLAARVPGPLHHHERAASAAHPHDLAPENESTSNVSV